MKDNQRGMDWKILLLETYLTLFFHEILSTDQIDCPQFVPIEESGETTISCAPKNKVVKEAYWYRGSVSRTSPILHLKDGQPGGTEYGRGHFDIANNGDMIIRNASREHEAVYTYYAFFEDNTFEKKNVTILFTSTPEKPCPYIHGCSSCDACKLIVTNDGYLICSLTGVRPRMNIKWTFGSAKDGNFTSYPVSFEHDLITDTWNVSVELFLSNFSCEKEAVIHCTAQDDYGLLKISSSSVQVKTDICTGDSNRDKEINFLLVILLVGLFLILTAAVVSVLLCYSTRYRGGSRKHNNSTEQNEQLLAPLDEIVDNKQRGQCITQCLKEVYGRHCTLEPLPWGQEIPISFAYADCQLKLKTQNEVLWKASNEVFTDKQLKEAERVLIVGGAGCGKTSLTKALVQHWINEKDNQSILLYITAEMVTDNLNVFDLILKLLGTKSDVAITNLQSELAVSNLWLLIDGLDILLTNLQKEGNEEDVIHNEKVDDKKNVEDEKNEQTNKRSCLDATPKQMQDLEEENHKDSTENIYCRVTLMELLSGNLKFSTKVQVWATARRIENITMLYPGPYIELMVDKFSKRQLESYVRQTCSYYFNLTSNRDSECMSKGTSIEPKYSIAPDSLLCDTDPTRTSLRSNFKLSEEGKIKITNMIDFVETNKLHQDFCNAPSLLVLIVHILAAQYSSVINLPCGTVNNTGILISTVIKALEKRFMQHQTENTSTVDMDMLENTLEQLAYQSVCEEGSVVARDDSFPVKLSQVMTSAIEIGLLQHVGVTSDMEQSEPIQPSPTVEFCHEYIEEFFAARFIVNRLDEKSVREMTASMKENNQYRFMKFVSFLQNK